MSEGNDRLEDLDDEALTHVTADGCEAMRILLERSVRRGFCDGYTLSGIMDGAYVLKLAAWVAGHCRAVSTTGKMRPIGDRFAPLFAELLRDGLRLDDAKTRALGDVGIVLECALATQVAGFGDGATVEELIDVLERGGEELRRFVTVLLDRVALTKSLRSRVLRAAFRETASDIRSELEAVCWRGSFKSPLLVPTSSR